ncbi:MAG TPA: hypothetical protein VGM30_20275 [Puia sp.]|jgi:hypothetical protein
MRRIFILFLFIAPIVAYAQDVTGVWQGHFRSNNTAMRSSLFDDRYKFEVQIAQKGKSFEAVTYSYLSTVFYGKAAAAGTVNAHTGKVLLQEGKLLEVRNGGGDICIMTCFLQYTRSGDEEFLEGSYVSMNTRDSSNCGRGTIFLRKVPASDFYEEPFLVKREKEMEKEKEKGSTAKTGTAPKPTTVAKAGTTPKASKPRVAIAAKPKPAIITAAPKPATTPKTGTPGATAKTGATPKTSATAKTTTPPRNGATAKVPPPASISRAEMPRMTIRSLSGDSGSNNIGKKFPTIPPRVLLSRSNQVVRSLTVHTNEVTLNIYDDGAIDHDTISVYLDNKQVIDHAMLTDRPIVLTLHLDETNDYHELVMVAENEGEIPPNTSLMIVKAGDKEYEVRIVSTEQKNAVVTFKFEKPK